MTDAKTDRVPLTPDCVLRDEHLQPLVKTRELPAIDAASLDREPDGADAEGVPCVIADGDVTVPVQSSIESTLTFEVLRRQSIKTDDDEGGL